MKVTIKPLEPPDSIHLRAAEGWLELGDQIEANEELEKITPQLRVHPDVLELRWQIYAKEKKWEACVDIARAVTKLAPERPGGWVHPGVCAATCQRRRLAGGVGRLVARRREISHRDHHSLQPCLLRGANEPAGRRSRLVIQGVRDWQKDQML